MAITLISTVTVGAGGATSIDFNSIPGTYTDLLLVTSLRGAAGAAYDWMQFRLKVNGSSSLTTRLLQGSGSSAASYSNANGEMGPGISGTSATASTFGSNQMYIANYASTTANKSISYDGLMETNGTTAYSSIAAALYASNTAITSLTVYGLDSGGSARNLAEYSTATLYGILKGSSGGVTVS